MNYKKITIVGCSSTGKTTLGLQLSKALNLKAVDLDEYFWNPNWIETPTEKFKEDVFKAIDCDRWVCSGNYNSKVQPTIMDQADCIIWLDYSFPLVFYRVLVRTFKRILSQESCCNGNYESLYKQFLTKDSILLWVIKMHGPYHKIFLELLDDEKYKKKNVYRFTKPSQTSSFLEKISKIN